MKYTRSGAGCAYRVDFIVDGELVAPDTGSVSFSLKDNALQELWTANPITVPAGQSSVTVVINGSLNSRTLTYEVRYIEVSFLYNGAPYTISDHYIIIDSTNFPLNPGDVRAVLGLTLEEVPNEQIDIISALASVQDEVGDDFDLDALVVAGNASTRHIIEAVKLRAAVDLVASIQTSLFQMEQSDNTLYKRFSKIDFVAIEAALRGRYAVALAAITAEAVSERTLAIVATGIDPITNT